MILKDLLDRAVDLGSINSANNVTGNVDSGNPALKVLGFVWINIGWIIGSVLLFLSCVVIYQHHVTSLLYALDTSDDEYAASLTIEDHIRICERIFGAGDDRCTEEAVREREDRR